MIVMQTLGTAEIAVGAMRFKPVSAKRFACLLYLAAEAGRPVARASLQEMFFPELADRNAQHALRELLYQLRQSGVTIRTDKEGVVIPAEVVRSDYSEASGAEQLDVSVVRAVEGGFLPGYAPALSELFSEWLEGFRARTVFTLCKALIRQAHRSKAAGDWSATEGAARACLALDPLNEEATLALAEMLALGGAKVQAIELLDRYSQEVGDRRWANRLPTEILRKRISERFTKPYANRADFPLVGRSEISAALQLHLDNARRGRLHVIQIHGEAGVGKTRLARHLSELGALAGFETQTVSARPGDSRRPMGAFIELVPKLLQLSGALGCSPESLETLQKVGSSHPSGDAELTRASLEATSAHIAKCIGDLLDAIAQEQPLLLVMEDVHWLDDLSCQAIFDVQRWAPATRVLVALTTRDGNRLSFLCPEPELMSVLPVPPLPPSDAAALCALILETGSVSDVSEWIQDTAGGNALYITMLAAHYRESGKSFDVPSGLLELIRRRVDGLGPRAAVVLQTCVVLGNRCTLERLTTVLEMPHVELVLAINELYAAGFLKTGEPGIAVAHPLIAEAVLSEQTPGVLALTHRRVATILEKDSQFEQSASLRWDCADHWLAAGDSDRGVNLLIEAANHILSLGRPRESAELLAYAASVEREPLKRVDLLKRALNTAGRGIEHDLVLRYASELRKYAIPRLHDENEAFELGALAGAYQDNNDFEARALECVNASTATATHRYSAGLAALKYADIFGRNELVQQVLHPLKDLDTGDVEPSLRLQFALLSESLAGTPDGLVRAARDLGNLARSTDGLDSARMRITSAVALWLAGHVEESIGLATEAYDVAQSGGAARMRMVLALFLAGTHLEIGADGAGIEWIAVAERAAKDIGSERPPIELSISQIDAALTSNDVRTAEAVLQRSIEDGGFNTKYRQRWQRAFELRLRQLGGGPPPADGEVASMLNERTRNGALWSLPDLEVAVGLYQLLRSRPAECRGLARRYFATRSWLCPISRALQIALADCDCGDMVTGWAINPSFARPFKTGFGLGEIPASESLFPG